jgi:hypothetical protein
LRRFPAVAGSFYEANPAKLRKQIEWSFLHPVGPGKIPEVPVSKGKRSNLFFVSPHAGYIYSGPVAAHTYYYLASEGKPDLVIIMGPNHTGLGAFASVWPEGYWETPLGAVEVDAEIAKELVRESKVLDFDETAHMYEHSVEVQVPFLQYFFGNDFKIVPIVILMQEIEIMSRITNAIEKVMREHEGLDVVVIASSDLNHYEPYELNNEKDELAIREIEKLDYEGLYRVVNDMNVTACGYGPIMGVLMLARKFNKRPYVLKHANSGDTSGPKDSVVGYLSVRFGD